ncbi:FAD-dependent monooxygenase [Flavobacterium olei]|uniref:FAD-dependent monooxygenase n=1 Tax=Flavobacterium olei TaxID=1886782 RepID=UPI00321BA7B9
METEKKIKVLISGASVAGLTTAYWLLEYGFNVTIVERAPYIRAGGQALDVRGPALEVAERMGILEDIHVNSTHLNGMIIVDASSGKELSRTTEHTITRGKHDSPDVEVLRDDLLRVLLKAVGSKAEYIFNDTIVSISSEKEGVDVTFSNASAKQFDLVIGADGLHSNVRKKVFGDEKQYMRYLGHYVAIFTIPNILDLDHWEVIYQHNDAPVAAYIVKERESAARVYLGFSNDTPLEYDYHDINIQKRMITERTANVGKDIPKILEYMQESKNFYFDSMNQILMDTWSKGKVTLVGDAGYSVSVSLGQGTTVAMVGAYVLAGELATHKNDLQKGLNSYEVALRDYVELNQKLAYNSNDEIQQESMADPNHIPDFTQSIVPFKLKEYLL